MSILNSEHRTRAASSAEHEESSLVNLKSYTFLALIRANPFFFCLRHPQPTTQHPFSVVLIYYFRESLVARRAYQWCCVSRRVLLFQFEYFAFEFTSHCFLCGILPHLNFRKVAGIAIDILKRIKCRESSGISLSSKVRHKYGSVLYSHKINIIAFKCRRNIFE